MSEQDAQELAQAVATSVMGWRIEWREVSPIYGIPSNRVYDVVNEDGETLGTGQEDAPSWVLGTLLTWEGAGQVVKRMNQLGYSFTLTAVPMISSAQRGVLATFDYCVLPPRVNGRGKSGHTAEERTAPEAICRAALKAVSAQ